MLDQFEVPVYIAGRMPQLKMRDKDIYQSMQTLTDYTRRMAFEHNFKMVEKCLELVEKIYERHRPRKGRRGECIHLLLLFDEDVV